MTSDRDHYIPREMYSTAMAYLRSAELLAGNVHHVHGRGAVLLSCLAFEILLKCAVRLAGGDPRFGHCYRDGWRRLPEDVRDSVESAAHTRAQGRADLSSIGRILEDVRFAFSKARYDYEFLEGRAREENVVRGERWLEAGAPLDEADIRYRPVELQALTYGLCRWIENELDVRPDVAI